MNKFLEKKFTEYEIVLNNMYEIWCDNLEFMYNSVIEDALSGIACFEPDKYYEMIEDGFLNQTHSLDIRYYDAYIKIIGKHIDSLKNKNSKVLSDLNKNTDCDNHLLEISSVNLIKCLEYLKFHMCE